MSQKFWAIWKETSKAPFPLRYSSKQEAIKAASEGLGRSPSGRYHILEVVGVVKTIEAPIDFEEIK